MYKVYLPNDPDSYYEYNMLHVAQAKAKELGTPVLDRHNKEVKMFRIERRQSHFEYFEIEASSSEEALERLKNWPSTKPVYDTWGEEYFYTTEEIEL